MSTCAEHDALVAVVVIESLLIGLPLLYYGYRLYRSRVDFTQTELEQTDAAARAALGMEQPPRRRPPPARPLYPPAPRGGYGGGY